MNDLYNRKTAIINGIIILENQILTSHIITLKNDRIEDIIPKKEFIPARDIKIYDVQGMYIMPGLIDIHSDIIENIVSPRKGVLFDPFLALTITDKTLLSQGITTLYHSLYFASTTICGKERTLGIKQMKQISDAIKKHRQNLILNHKLHVRLELNCREAYEIVYEMLQHNMVDELSLMDHTPGQGQYTNIHIFRQEIEKQYGKLSEEEENQIINKCNKPLLDKASIETLLNCAREANIPIAYHDVDTASLLKIMKEWNINICEFPIYEAIAIAARENDFFVVVGAPNILRGESHHKNVFATDLVKKQIANVICSDYYPWGLLPAVFKLHNTSKIPLHKIVYMVTLSPAKAVKIGKDYGSIEKGKKADLIVVDASNELPTVKKIFIDGKIVLDQ
ncbi:MAG: alpha-D-ribose 1-methylphosphonate 5-triphosphate diphosphatase [Clostridium sp.]|nr:alpha-D-ribose 1-methylphosphonate 5-triphosphate diphosphatase [Clostridium sp.]